MSDLEARLACLEKHCSRLRVAVLALGVVLIAVVGISMSSGRPATGQASPSITDVVQAQRFILVDAAGRRVAVMGPSKEESGAPALSFYREDGRLGAMLGAGGAEGSVLMLNGDGSESMSLVVEKGSAGIGYQTKDGTDMFGLGADKTGNVLCMNNSAGKCRINLLAPAEGNPSITLKGEGKETILKP